MNESEATAGISLQLKRVLSAPRERVFRAWTDPGEFAQWFSPSEKHQVRMSEQDLREGGRYRIDYRTPEGALHVMVGTYRLVRAPEKLVFTWRYEKGGVGEAETLVTVELRDREGNTELVLTHERFTELEVKQRHEEGWGSHLDRLQEYVGRAGRS